MYQFINRQNTTAAEQDTFIVLPDLPQKRCAVSTCRDDLNALLHQFSLEYPALCSLESTDTDGCRLYTVAQSAVLLTIAHPLVIDMLTEE